MNGRKKVKEIINLPTPAVFACVALMFFAGVGWSDTDHRVVVLEPSSLGQIVEDELNSREFAKQIAAYNGIAAVNTIVPGGTTIQIPKPYLLNREFGQVVFSKGDVVHTQKTLVTNPPVKSAFVYQGDTFSTGADGFVSLKFSSGSVVNIQPDSRISVVDIACVDENVSCIIELNAESGKVSSQVTPRPDGQPPVKFTVTTPFLSAAVRGTAFYVHADDDSGRIGVTDGLVAVNAGGSSNNLPEGKGLVAKANAQPVLVDLLDAPELTTADDLVYSAEDSFHWKPLNGAQQYSLTIAEDESLSKPLHRSEVQNNGLLLPDGLLAGQYHLSVAGIDNNKFRGLSTTRQFTYAEIDDHERLQLQIEQPAGEVKIAPVDYTGSVEILIKNGFDNPTDVRRIVGTLSNGLSLELDLAQDWVIQARKLFSSTSVSVYSNQYFLRADSSLNK